MPGQLAKFFFVCPVMAVKIMFSSRAWAIRISLISAIWPDSSALLSGAGGVVFAVMGGTRLEEWPRSLIGNFLQCKNKKRTLSESV